MAEEDILCNYQKGEEKGVGLLVQLNTFAPSEVRQEITEQIVDERKHDRLFSGRLKDLDIDCFGMNHSLEAVYDLAQECVDQKDWVSSITIQTVIEELAMATFTDRVLTLDADTQVVLREIIHDEARHLQFGLREMEKFAEGNEEKIRAIHMRVLKIFLATFNDPKHSKEDLKRLTKVVKKAYRMHKVRLGRIGVELPDIKKVVTG